ncbi:outer membrane protein assembly factor [Candidatus Margulisiibacteriota bacterium]
MNFKINKTNFAILWIIRRMLGVVLIALFMIGFIPQVLFCQTNNLRLNSKIDFDAIISEIKFTGLKLVDKAQFLGGIELVSKKGFKPEVGSIIRDINNIYLTGYFSKVDAYTKPANNRVDLVFTVQENPVIRDIKIIGNKVFSSEHLRWLMKNKKDKVLNVRLLKEDALAITELYHENGYQLFKFHNVVFDSGKNVLVIDISEGIVRDVSMDGLKTLEPKVVLRDLHLQPKTVFNLKLLNEDREKLLKKGYFSEVYFPRFNESLDKRKVSIVYKVEEKTVNLLDFGLEHNDEYRGKVVGFLKTDLNHFIQQTDILSAKTQFSVEQNALEIISYSSRYFQPWLLNTVPISFSLGVRNEYRYELLTKARELYRINRAGADMVFGFPIIKGRLDFMTKYKIEEVTPPAPLSKYMVNSLTGVIQYQSVSNWDNPKGGMYWQFEMERGGDIGFVKLRGLDFSRYHVNYASFLKVSNKDVIGFHTSWGLFRRFLEDIDTFDAEGFEIGGVSTMRGFKEDYAFYGSRKILFNVEYRHDFTEFIQGVVFLDTGKVFENGWDVHPSTFNYSKGLGVRFFTPLGPIRFDFSFGEAFIIHFGLGQLF